MDDSITNDKSYSQNMSLGVTEKELNLMSVYKHAFIETPFARRFQGFVNEMRLERKWAVIGAYSRNGKTWSIMDIIKSSGAIKEYNGHTRIPIIAVRSPESSTPNDLISSLCRCFGSVPLSSSSAQRKWLISAIPKLGVEQIIIDDAHELNLNHLKFIKWLTDLLELEMNYHVSLILSSIISSNSISIWNKIQQYRHEDWMQQLYERFSLCREIPGHTYNEVAEILYAYEELYRPLLSNISLVKYTDNIYTWLTCSELDIHNCRRVAMEHLSKLIYESVKIAYIEYSLENIPLDLIFHVYKSNFLNKDKILSIEDKTIYKPKSNEKKKNAI
jgi:hypothetical protein